MLSQISCYWDKQKSADSKVIHFHLTLKFTAHQSYHFCDCFLASNVIFHHHDRGLTKFHAGFEQPLVCVLINDSQHPAVKKNNPRYPKAQPGSG